MIRDFHCQVCDKDFEKASLPGNHLQRRRICEPCREIFLWCNKCKRAKLKSDFDRCANTSTGKQSMCRSCRIDITGLIRIRECAHCLHECVVENHNRYNGRNRWLCDECYPLVKHCKMCGTLQPLDQFNKSRDKRNGRVAHCRKCMAVRWTASDHETRTRAKRRKFGLDYDAYLAMCIEQGNRCSICGEPESDVHQGTGKVRELAIDHDHETGRVRGLLCGKCNKAVGLMADNPERLRSAAVYLELNAAQSLPEGVI